jgi:hypothetical protein
MKTWKIIQEDYQPKDSTSARYLTSALHKIKLKKNNNHLMKILSDTSVVEVRLKKTLDEKRKIDIVQSCAGDNYAQAIVVADGNAQIKLGETHNATALELCKFMKKTWQIAGHNNEDKEDNDEDDDSKQLETLLGAVKQKQSTINKRCFHCNSKKGHRLLLYCYKKKKSMSEKTGAAAEIKVNKSRSKCSHCGRTGHDESSCWKKYLHKAPSKSSMEASGAFLEEELLVCNIKVDDTYCITENIENTYYCVPIT